MMLNPPPAVRVCFALTQVMPSLKLMVGRTWEDGRAYGFKKGSTLVWNRSGPVSPLKDWSQRVYPKFTTLMRLELRMAVYCAANPLLLSRRVEAGDWLGNCAGISSSALWAKVLRRLTVCFPALSM